MIITYKDHKRVYVKIRKLGWLLGVTDLSLWKPGIDAACAAYSVKSCCVCYPIRIQSISRMFLPLPFPQQSMPIL